MKKSPSYARRSFTLTPGPFAFELDGGCVEIPAPTPPLSEEREVPYAALHDVMRRKVDDYLTAGGKERKKISEDIVRAVRMGYLLRPRSGTEPETHRTSEDLDTEGGFVRTYRYLSIKKRGKEKSLFFYKKPPKRFLGIGKKAIDVWGGPVAPSD